mgnify:CR=1 FL=1
MSIEVKVPELPESITEATVGAWHKKAGDGVDRDENILDLETDKVMLEVPAEAAGVLKEIRAKEGETVKAGDILAIIEEGESAGSDNADDQDDEPQDDEGEESAKAPEKEESKAKSSKKSDDEDSGDADATPSPAARKLIDEHGLDVARIKGSGKDGRITKADVQKAVDESDEEDTKSEKQSAEAEEKPAEKAKDTPKEESHETADRAAMSTAGDRNEERVSMTRIRARIAERLLDVSQNTAMLTTFNEIDMQSVRDVRARYKEKFQKDHDVRLGFMSFFVKAVIEALKRFPIVNASIDENDIVYHGFYDIGIAVSSPRGLLVPVLRDADQMSYAEIEETMGDLGKRAQESKITMDDLKGGTFTITNGGVFGSMLSTPILNPPQSAILGMHNITDRAVVIDGEVVVRPMMYVALSYDHRIIDGRDAVLFLRTIKELIEDPARLLLQI